jgi:hypothetical protein
MKIHIKLHGHYMTFTCTPNEVRRLEDAEIMGRRFIKLGDKNYNISLIEYWWAEEDDD